MKVMSLRARPVAHPRRTVAVAAHDACGREPRIDTVLRAGLALSTGASSQKNRFNIDDDGYVKVDGQVWGPRTRREHWIPKYLVPRYMVENASRLLDKENGVNEELAFLNSRLKNADPEYDDIEKYDPEYYAGPEALKFAIARESRTLKNIREKRAVQEQALQEADREIATQWAAVAKARQELWTATHWTSKSSEADKQEKQEQLRRAEDALYKSLEKFEEQHSSILQKLSDWLTTPE